VKGPGLSRTGRSREIGCDTAHASCFFYNIEGGSYETKIFTRLRTVRVPGAARKLRPVLLYRSRENTVGAQERCSIRLCIGLVLVPDYEAIRVTLLLAAHKGLLGKGGHYLNTVMDQYPDARDALEKYLH
jgi:hypothetical protein